MNHPSAQPEPFAVEPVPGLALSGEVDGGGRPLVLLHGLTATRRYVLQGSRMLARRGFSLVSYDARGHGASSAAPDGVYDYDALVADLVAVLDARGLDRVVLAGSSMGAHTAAAFAAEAPERVEALVAITPAYRGEPDLRPETLAVWDARADALAAGDFDRFVTLAGADDVPEPLRDTTRLAVRQRAERHEDLAAVAAATRGVPRSAAFDGLGALASVAAPALVVASGDAADPQHPFAVAQEWAEALPNGRLVTEEAGESPLAWRGAQLSRAIASFLEGVLI